MRNSKLFALAALLLPVSGVPAGGQHIQTHDSAIARWGKYSLVKIANGVNGCANAAGCWNVNGVLGPNAAAALAQNVPLFQLPANGFVSGISLKVAVQCSGAATATTGLGTASAPGLYVAAPAYNIDSAAAPTNLYNALASPGRATAAAENVEANLVTTVNNVDQLITGCAVDYWVLRAVLP